MVVKALSSLHRVLLLLALTVALTATGFAHRMPTDQDGALAFALANGADASDFCGGAVGGDRAKTLHCPACQIMARGDIPPESTTMINMEFAFHAPVRAPRLALAFRSIQDPAHRPHGPPVA